MGSPMSATGFDELVAEGASAEVDGWGFGWLAGRATEERPPWGYARLLAERLPRVRSALDIDTGGGEVIAEMPALPSRMWVTESWPPNARRAAALLTPRGIEVVPTHLGDPLPFPDACFDLVVSRHPVAPNWPEIARVLVDDGRYLAQHVGPDSAGELIDYFCGPQPGGRTARHPDKEVEAARASELELVDLRTARCRMEFFDVGAVVYILRKCVWWVPDFDVERYRETLRRIYAHIRTTGPFVAHSTRHLIELRRKYCRHVPPSPIMSSASGEVVALLEVGDQSRTGGLPSEQVVGDLCRGGAVDSPEAAEEAEVVACLLGGDGDGGDVEMLGEDLGDLEDRHALVAHGVKHRPGGRGLDREAEQARRIIAVDRRPAVGAVADVGCDALRAREADRGGDEPVVAVAVGGRWEPHDGGADPVVGERESAVGVVDPAVAAADRDVTISGVRGQPVAFGGDGSGREPEHTEDAGGDDERLVGACEGLAERLDGRAVGGGGSGEVAAEGDVVLEGEVDDAVGRFGGVAQDVEVVERS